uniref:Rna-binding protein related n=2 Tax=Schistosoma mansoni TaxID=6183 RepID=A0A3Q0KS80_SCHMA
MGEVPEKSDKDVKSLPQYTRRRQEIIHLKILVPSVAVGAIIGKGGESIAKIQKETGARIKLSKVNDLYPGTEERVCLIQGTLEGVTRMHNYIMDCVLEKPECSGPAASCVTTNTISTSRSENVAISSTTQGDSSSNIPQLQKGSAWSHSLELSGSRLPWGRHKQVKILVPNCTAGLVIGKLGSYVREIKDRTGAFIQISQKSVEINLLERCITIAGEPEQCRAAVDLVLAKIAEDPQSAIYPAISYSHVRGPVASAYPTGSPFAIMPSVRFDTSQGSHLRLPPGRGASCGNIEGWDDNVPSGVGFSAVANPFGSSLFHAALLQVQAAALAANLNTTGYYPTLPSVDMAPTNMSTLFTHGLSTNIGYVSPEDATVLQPALPEYGQGFCSATPTGNVSLLGSGGGASGGSSNTGGGSGGHGSTILHESIWPIGESQIQTPTCFDAAYPGPLNFAIYPTNQSLLTAMASRHPSESYQSHPDIFAPSSPYMTGISQPSFTIPYSTSPSLMGGNGGNLVGVPQIDPGGPQLATLYPGISPSLCLSQPFPVSVSSEMDVKVAPIRQQPPTLNELLGSLRLGCKTEDVVSEINQTFSTLTRHGFLNMAGSGPFPLISPAGSQPASYIAPLLATHLPSPTAESRSSIILPEDNSANLFVGVRPSTIPDTSFMRTTKHTPSYSDSTSNVYSHNQSLGVPSSKPTQSYSEIVSGHEHDPNQSLCSQSSGCIPAKEENVIHTFPSKSHDAQFCEFSASSSASVDVGDDSLASATLTEVTKKQSLCSSKDIGCCSSCPVVGSSPSIHTTSSSSSLGSCACSSKLNFHDSSTQCQQLEHVVTESPSSKSNILQGSKTSSSNEQNTSPPHQIKTDN